MMTKTGEFDFYHNWNRKYWLALIAAVLIFSGLEWKFYVVERAVGQFLAWNNMGREQLGPTWEKSKNRLLAGSRLENIASQIRASERKLRSVKTFDQVLELLGNDRQLELSRVHFERVYRSLPFYLKPLLLSADSLLALGAQGILAKTLWVQNVTALDVYFLDDDNALLSHAVLSREQIDMILRNGKAEVINLNAESRFSGIRTFSLKRFSQKLGELDYEIRQNFFHALPALFEYAEPATKIAISNKIVSSYVEIAVMIDAAQAYIYYLPEEWINDFVSVLDREDFLNDEDENIL